MPEHEASSELQSPAAPTTYRGRFAPSPSGDLHAGSLLAAVASRCDALHHSGQWRVRIDDIDPPRNVAGSDDSILASLTRFGFQPAGTIDRQSQHTRRYRECLLHLADQGLLFRCHCSRKSLQGTRIYPGHCRKEVATRDDLSLNKTSVATFALRLRLVGTLRFEDLIRGDLPCDLDADVGDVVVRRRDGLFAYSLACAVDDGMDMSHVIRGGDLLPTTAVQLAIQDRLGLGSPQYGHIPIVVNRHGQKLSKQTHAAPIDQQPAIPALQLAWRQLGQLAFQFDTIEEFWATAPARWQRERIPAGTTGGDSADIVPAGSP